MIIDIIGKGKVGHHLQNALDRLEDSDCRLIDSRTLEGHRPEADICFLTVSDNAITEVASRFKDYNYQGIIAHVSGSTPIDALESVDNRGVFYPFQSFSHGVEVDFAKVPIFIEGSNPRVESVLNEIAGRLSNRVIKADGEQRRKLHLAGVFSCNFLNEMMAIGFGIMRDADLKEDLLYPLIRMTVQKALEQGPESVRTGPAARHDTVTINRQLEMLSSKPIEQEIYSSVTDLILRET